MAVGAQLRIGNGSEISPLRKLMAAAVVFLAADFFLLINFMASEVNRVSARGREGRGFYFIPIALAAYYACTWVLVARRRPEREPIVVQYKPPEGVSPAEAGYIYTLTCDGRTYAAIVADLAARGLLTIEPTRDGIYVRSAIELPDAGRNGISAVPTDLPEDQWARRDRKSTRLNSSHLVISYAVFCLKKKNNGVASRDGRRADGVRPRSRHVHTV